jgi:hypothetical protein
VNAAVAGCGGGRAGAEKKPKSSRVLRFYSEKFFCFEILFYFFQGKFFL